MRNIEEAAMAVKEADKAVESLRQAQNAMRPQYRPLTPDELKRLESLKEMGAQLWDAFNRLGASREVALAKTNLEQAVMWAVKHITA